MAAVREFYGLSAREAEVAELIARGNTVAHIAELLFVSENTVRTHSKRIYVKLDIHKRQELIALVESRHDSERSAFRIEINCRARAPSIAPAVAPWCNARHGTGGRGLCPGPC